MKSLLFVILLLIVTTLSCDITEFQYSFKRQCGNSSSQFARQYLVIDKSVSYLYNYSFVPPISPDRQTVSDDNTQFHYFLQDDIQQYTLTWTPRGVSQQDQSSCGGQYTFTPDNPKLSILHPKCSFSFGRIEKTSISSSAGIVTVDNNPLPFEAMSSNTIYQLKYENTQEQFTCVTNFQFYQQSNQYPNLKLINPVCGNQDGSIQLLNSNSITYTSTSLVFASNGTTINQNSLNTWNSLPSTEYTLNLQSTQCDKQVINLKLDNEFPKFHFNYSPLPECPANILTVVEFDDPTYNNQFTFTKDNLAVGNSFYIKQNTSYTLSINHISNNQCQFQKTFFAQPLVLDVQFDIQYPLDCQNPYIINMYYNESQITDLKVMLGWTPINVINKSFISEGRRFLLDSQCYGSKRISVPLTENPPPSYTLSRQPRIKGDTFDLYVNNIQSYQSISIIDQMGQTNYHENGWFRNITTYKYNFLYKEKGCTPLTMTHNVDFSNNLEKEQISYETKIIRNPGCGLDGLIGSRLYYHNMNISSQEKIYTFIQGQNSISLSADFEIYGLPKQTFNYQYFISNTLIVKELDVVIKIIQNTTCKYSNDGIISITLANGAIDYIIINGNQFNPSSVQSGVYVFDNIPSGSLSLLISASECRFIRALEMMSNNSDFTFNYITTPVSQCNTITPDGSILVQDTNIYEHLLFDTTNLLLSNGEINGLVSNFYTIDFKLTNNTCFGKANVYIPSLPIGKPTITNVIEPYCKESNTGVIAFTLLDQENRQMEISNVKDLISNISYTDGYANNMVVGEYNQFLFSSGACSYVSQHPHLLNHREISFNSVVLADYLYGSCERKTFFKFNSNHFAAIDGIDFFNEKDGSPITVDRFNDDVFGYKEINGNILANIRYGNNTCSQTITAVQNTVAKASLFNSKAPSFTIIQNDCSSNTSADYSIYVDNPSNIPMRIHNSSPNPNGYWLNIPSIDQSDLVFYDPASSCKYTPKYENTELEIQVETIPETCPGSYNGIIKFDNKDYSFDLKDSDSVYSTPTSHNSANTFGSLTGTSYKLLRSKKSNPFCTNYQMVEPKSIEPEVTLTTYGFCDATDFQTGQIGIITNHINVKNLANITYNINGIVSDSAEFQGFPRDGVYYSTVTIQDPNCPRVLTSNSVSFPTIPSQAFSLDSSKCLTAKVIPKNQIELHQYVVKDVSFNVVLQKLVSGNTSFYFNNPGVYSIFSTNKDHTCGYQTEWFTISACSSTPDLTPPPGNDDLINRSKRDRTSLIIVISVPIGATIIVVGASIAFYMYKKNKVNSKLYKDIYLK